jgi:hypothetical protein
VSRTRCGILHAAPQSRDRTKRRSSLRPRLCSAPLRKCCALRCVRGTATCKFYLQISNSHAASFSRRRASWAFSSLPSTLRGDGAPKGAPWVQLPQHDSRLRKPEAAERLPTLHPQRFLSLGPNFRAQARASSPSRQVSPPFTCPVQPFKAAPRSGPGRLPKASRVRACEARPQAPHQPSGCPSGQLSLCPTSVTPLEAPLTGQDPIRISEVLNAGIGIHSQARERKLEKGTSARGTYRTRSENSGCLCK